jgi:uncharacterized cupredoxin-like copper-binding protein
MRLLAGIAVCAVMATAGFASAGGSRTRTVEITIENSLYSTAGIDVEFGEKVTFEITNTDPISHEFIVGDEVVQRKHERGTEAYHGAIPTEVTIPPGERVTTTITFDSSDGIDPGEANYYACHLPGHYDYGMVGRIRLN